MLFRALTIVSAAIAAFSLSGCVTGETIGSANCCTPNAYTLDGNPVPGNGDAGDHLADAWCAQKTNMRQINGTIKYWAFNTNADYPPYETFWCDQFPRAMYMIGKKFDEHLYDYDWDDPFIRCSEPCCDQPKCTMRYVDPCDRKPERCYEPCVVTYEPCDPCDPCAPR